MRASSCILEISRFGASPDGLVGDDGLIQIKCPNTSTHLNWMMAQAVPLEHMPQMLAEMSCTGRAWCDFVSYDPRLPERYQLFIIRFARDERLIAALEAEVVKFNSEIANYISQLPGGPQLVVDTLDVADKDEKDWVLDYEMLTLMEAQSRRILRGCEEFRKCVDAAARSMALPASRTGEARTAVLGQAMKGIKKENLPFSDRK